ncbi:hypothetical protein IIA16_00375, partial [bacterium]|nr:hypothetical protein [bacterium]
ALGAYRALGEERYISAALRRKSGWAIALDLAGGVAEVVGSLAQFRHARGAWAAAATDAEAADLLAEGATNFLAAPREAQQSTLLRIAQLSDMRQGGRAMTALEETVLERGTLLLNEMETLRDIVPPRYLDPNVLEGTETLTMNNGRVAIVSRRGSGSGVGTLTSPGVDIEPMRIPENRLWHNYDVRTRLGLGAYAQVFEIPGADGTVRALKVYEAGQDGLDDVQRALRAEAILADAGIPQLRIIENGVHDGMAYLVQEIMPSPGIYRPVTGQMMDDGMAEALLGLYQKLGQEGIGWADGWWANVYFFREGDRGPLIAGILDQDRVWEIGSGINSGVWGGTSNDLMTAILGAPGFKPFKIRSLAGTDYTPAALALLERGFSPWPDAEFFMMKMLEHRKWIKYDRELGKFVSDRMDIDLVKDYFPRLDNLESIDPMFDVPDHLRPHGPDLPIGELPDDLGGDNAIPEAELALAA